MIKIESTQFGFSPRKLINATIFLPKFCRQLMVIFFKSKDIKIKTLYPQLHDYRDNSGVASGHYFHQDIIVARWIYEDNPIRHVDIASRIDGFVAHLAVFREVEVLDIRNLETNEPNINFKQHDFTKKNTSIFDIESVSCLHSIEHFGLGRYSDKIDINGHLKGFMNISNLLKKNGAFYFSVPIGPLRIEFNAHRVFSVEYIINNFILPNKLTVAKCSVVKDDSTVLNDVNIRDGQKDDFGCKYGLIILKLIKS